MKEYRPLLVRVLFCIALFTSARVSGQVQTPRQISTGPNSGGFYEYLPARYAQDSTKTFPLIVFIHGAGQFGNGSTQLPLVLQSGLAKLIANKQFPDSFVVEGKAFEFIVISPQFSAWPSDDDVNSVIQYSMLHYRVDTGRIYLTGLSMGGDATWSYASYPQWAGQLAAIVPIASDTNYHGLAGAQAMAANNLAIFATHNKDDNTLPSSADIYNVDQVNSITPPINPSAQVRIFLNSGHDAWDSTYNPKSIFYRDLDIYQWMLLYSRDSGGNMPLPPLQPRISNFQPQTAGAGTKVTIWGVNLTGVDSVFFGSVPAASFTVVSDSEIVATVGNGASGPVRVMNVSGTASAVYFTFTGGPPPPPLQGPVGFLSFNAMAIPGVQPQTELAWTDSSEVYNSYFVVQRSADSIAFNSIDIVQAVPGASGGFVYTDFDKQPLSGIGFYRVMQVHTDGTTSLSVVRTVVIGQGTDQSSAFPSKPGIYLSPNPATSALDVVVGGTKPENLQIRLVDLMGNTLKTWYFEKSESQWMQSVSVGDLAPGTYFIQAICKDWQDTKTFLKR